MKEPVELLLRALLGGLEIPHNGRRYVMCDDGSLGLLARNETANEELALRLDCDLRDFKALADSIGGDELWLLCCGLAMSEHRAMMN